MCHKLKALQRASGKFRRFSKGWKRSCSDGWEYPELWSSGEAGPGAATALGIGWEPREDGVRCSPLLIPGKLRAKRDEFDLFPIVSFGGKSETKSRIHKQNKRLNSKGKEKKKAYSQGRNVILPSLPTISTLRPAPSCSAFLGFITQI